MEKINEVLRKWATFCYGNSDYVIKRDSLKDDKSYSCLVPVDMSGMSLGLFPGSNKLDRLKTVFHKSYSVCFEFPYPFAVLFDSDTLHYGKKSRTGSFPGIEENCVLEDRCAFMYIQQNRRVVDKHNTRSLTSVKPENDRVYGVIRPCNYLLNEWDDSCFVCKQYEFLGEKVVDIEKIYSEEDLDKMEVGTVVAGDMDEFGFIIFKSFDVDKATIMLSLMWKSRFAIPLRD